MPNRLRLKTMPYPLPCSKCGIETRKLYPLKDKHVCFDCWDAFIARNEALYKFNPKHAGYYHSCPKCYTELTHEERDKSYELHGVCKVCHFKRMLAEDGSALVLEADEALSIGLIPDVNGEYTVYDEDDIEADYLVRLAENSQWQKCLDETDGND